MLTTKSKTKTDASWRITTNRLQPVSALADLRQLLLDQRGLPKQAITDFFEPRYDHAIHDPFLLPDMPKASERIWHSIRKKEHILIYGDYDVDGLTSTAILMTTLKELGARVSPYIPNRADDGYGLNAKVLKAVISDIDLLITVDCGITAAKEVAQLNKKKVDTIIIDHHTLPAVLPPAYAIIHAGHPDSKYPEPNLCGAGVAWKVAAALYQHKDSPFKDDPDHPKWLLDLAALGTVADMVPLLNENRAIVKFGLQVLARTRRTGLKVLLDSVLRNKRITENELSFKVIPLLNAAGRIDDAQDTLKLLLSEDTAHATQLLRTINKINRQRQSLTKDMIIEAEEQLPDLNEPIIFVHNHAWNIGLVGLAAGRLADKFNRPAIVLGGNGGNAVGSARSPKHFNVLKLLEGSRRHLSKLGGHERAAGFTVTNGNVKKFHQSLLRQAADISAAPNTESQTADAVLAHNLIDFHTIDTLAAFAPFGMDNPEPAFVVKQAPLLGWQPVGKENTHAKFTFLINKEVISGIGFNLASRAKKLELRKTVVDVLCKLERDEYRGHQKSQLNVQDIALAGTIPII